MSAEQGGYAGQLQLATHYTSGAGERPTLEVLRADPQIRISPELLWGLAASTKLTEPDPPFWGSFDGTVLRLTATNGTWIYRLVGYDTEARQYLAAWPD